MARNVPAWVADHDDQAIPPRVRLRVVERQEGRCAGCSRAFDPKLRPEIDHILALELGGVHGEANLQALCPGCHKPKTAQDVALKAKADRIVKKRLGLENKRSRFDCARTGKWKAKIGAPPERRDR